MTQKAASTKGLYIKTYGCQMNAYDSRRMADVLSPLGYRPVETPDEADLVVLNTCHIREKATEKVFSELGRLRADGSSAERDGRRRLIAVAGCVAQAEGEAITARAPFVDLVFGPQTYHRLADLVADLERRSDEAVRRPGSIRGHRMVDTDFPAESKFDFLPQESGETGPAAFLSVQEGCDKFCTFCVVPYTRGVEFSRPAAQVVAEARRLAARGVRELTLLGQNVNAYHGDAPAGGTWGLGRLMRELASIDGIERLRYTTSHPLDMADDLIEAHRDVPEVMPYIHLPVQSGSNRMLAAMNRRHDRDTYLRAVDRLRAARPDIALSSDFIVGFPGETDADFADTLRLVREVGYAQAYSFKYSPRPGTPAATMEQVDEAVRADRLETLRQLLDAQQTAFNHAAIGGVQAVLVERMGSRPGQVVGRGPYMQAVHFDAGDTPLIGEIVEVRVTEAHPNSVRGEWLDRAGPADRPVTEGARA